MKSKFKQERSGLDNNPNSIFRASRSIRNIINKKLKEEQDVKDAQDAQTQALTVPPTSSPETEVNKNLSLFTFDIQQITTLLILIEHYITNEYIYNYEGGSRASQRRGRLGSSIASNMWNRDARTISHDSDSSTGQPSSRYSSVVDSDSDGSDSDESTQGIYINPRGDGGDGDAPFEEFDFEDGDDISALTESEFSNLPKKQQNILLLKEINRATNLVDHVTILWEDSILPNIKYISKIKLTNLLKSNLISSFEDAIERITTINYYYNKDDANNNEFIDELEKTLDYLINKLDNLIELINFGINQITGIQKGTVNGAGFLHLPTPYNSYLKDSTKKYLM